MTREGPTGVGSVPGSPTSISIIYRSRGMTSPDPEIDGGLPWIRGVDPAAGTRPGSRQDPAQEPAPKPPGSRGGSDPATNLGTDFTEEKPALEPTSRKRNPAAFQQCYVGNYLPSAVPTALLRIRFIRNVAPRPRNVSFAPVCIRQVRNLALRGPDRLRGAA